MKEAKDMFYQTILNHARNTCKRLNIINVDMVDKGYQKYRRNQERKIKSVKNPF